LAEKILTSKAALEWKRKQVTVLLADLKGSMELLADCDPEEARQLLDPVPERRFYALDLSSDQAKMHRAPPVASTGGVRPPCKLTRPNSGTCLPRHPHAIGGNFSLGPGRFIAPHLFKTLPQVQDGYAMVPFNDPGIRLELDENKLRPWVIRAPMVADACQPRYIKLRALLDHA
jgi:hypothetical protein